MKTKNLVGILFLFLCTISIVSCSDDDGPKDKTKTITMYISAETGMYQPWGSDKLLECMRVKEAGQEEYYSLGFLGISDFEYEKGYEYVLSVKKTTLANPPEDGSMYTYKLIEILSRKQVATPELPKDFTEADIKYKEGCPYPIYSTINSDLLVNAEGLISNGEHNYSYNLGWIHLKYALGPGDKYYNKLLYMTTLAFVIDPFMKSNSQPYIRLIDMSGTGAVIKDVLTKEAYEFMKNEAEIGETLTYKLVLLNAERLGIQDIEVSFTKN